MQEISRALPALSGVASAAGAPVADPRPGTAAQCAAFLKAECEKRGPIATASGAKVD